MHTPRRPAPLRVPAALLLGLMIVSSAARADRAVDADPPPTPPEPPSPAAPEAPRQPAGDAFEQLPEIAKRMLASANGTFTPVAHVETRGRGPTHLVLIPGLACDWTVWESFMRRHEERFTMHALTLPGFAGAEPPPMPNPDEVRWSDDVWMLNARRAVSAAIAALDLPDPPIVVGHSMGAHVALRLAVDEPQRVAAVVMVDGFAAWPLTPTPIPLMARKTMVDNQLAGWFDSQMAANEGRGIREMYTAGVSDEARGQALAAMSATTRTDVFKRYFLELVAGDLTAQLKSISCPVLAVAAIPPAPQAPAPAEGQPKPPDTREMLRTAWRTQFEGLDRVRLHFIEDCRHFVMDDAPVQLDESVVAFSDSVTPLETAPPSTESR